MMKKMLIIAAALSLVATSAMAASLVDIPVLAGQTGSEGTSITPDGVYVGGNSGSCGIVWSAANGSIQPVAGGYQDNVSGIGYRYPTAGGVELVIGGGNGGWQSMNSSTDGGVTWQKNRRTSTFAYGGGGQNTVNGTSVGGTIFSTFQTPSSSTPTLYIDAWGDAGWASAPDAKGTSSKSNISGVSNAGVAVGRRKDGTNFYRSYQLTFDGDGGLGAAYVPELTGSATGALWDIADDGSRAGGESGIASASTDVYPYVLEMATSTAIQLPVVNPLFTGSATKARVYGMSPDGKYAVGMDYTAGVEKAAFWDCSDANPANWTVTDLTQWASDMGILGAFTGNLRRAYAVGVNAQGQPVITGYGYAGTLNAGYTGYVLTLPEPATLSFLALGGLAMLRRRR